MRKHLQQRVHVEVGAFEIIHAKNTRSVWDAKYVDWEMFLGRVQGSDISFCVHRRQVASRQKEMDSQLQHHQVSCISFQCRAS